VPNAGSGAGIFAEATFAGLDVIGEPRRGIAEDATARRRHKEHKWDES